MQLSRDEKSRRDRKAEIGECSAVVTEGDMHREWYWRDEKKTDM